MNRQSASRKMVIPRQERYENEDDSLYALIADKRLKVLNYSRFGVALWSPVQEPELEQTFQMQLCAYGEVVHGGKAFLANSRPSDSGSGFVYGIALQYEIHIESVHAFLDAHVLRARVHTMMDEAEAVPPPLYSGIQKIEDLFIDYQRTLKLLLEELGKHSREYNSRYLETLYSRSSRFLHLELHKILEEAAARTGDISSGNKERLASYFVKKIRPFFEETELVTRTFEPAREYPCDYEWVNTILRHGAEGASPLGKILNQTLSENYFLPGYAARTKSFVSTVESELKARASGAGRAYSILIVQSGPALEVQRLINLSDQKALGNLHIDLLDVDERPLMYAQLQINRQLHEQKKKLSMRYVRLHTGETAQTLDLSKLFADLPADGVLGSYDFIYIPYLMDCLKENTSAGFVKKMASHLNSSSLLGFCSFSARHICEEFLLKAAEPEFQFQSGKVSDCLQESGFEVEQKNDPLTRVCYTLGRRGG